MKALPTLVRNSLAALPAGSSVLEIGAGDGALEPFISSLGLRYVGIDVAPRGPGIHELDAHYLRPARDTGRAYDAVLALACLQHMHDPWLVLQNCRRVLRHGGAMLGTWSWVYGTCDVESYTHLSAAGLKGALSRAGYYLDEVESEWPIWRSIPDLLFEGRCGASGWKAAMTGAIYGIEQSYRVARSVASCFGAPKLDLKTRELASAGALAFRATRAR